MSTVFLFGSLSRPSLAAVSLAVQSSEDLVTIAGTGIRRLCLPLETAHPAGMLSGAVKSGL